MFAQLAELSESKIMTESFLMGEPSKAAQAREANKCMNSEEAISGSCSGLAAAAEVMQE